MARRLRDLAPGGVAVLGTLVLLWVLPAPGGGLQEEPDTLPAEEVERRVAAAEAAPLFRSHDPLAVTLATDLRALRRERPEETEVAGTLAFPGPDGDSLVVGVKVRTRGDFRREKRNCDFPPLRLNVRRKEVEGTVLEGQDRLKLVTPCRYSRESYETYVLQEYLAYRVYGLVTPLSFRVRLLRITYVDTSGEVESRTKYAFLIEDEDAMAARNRAEVMDVERWHPYRMDGEASATLALFQYMIGNTDWSAPLFHNVKLLRTRGGRYIPVAYDFDFSGVVDAAYATPDPSLGLRNVRDRRFRGYCRNVDWEAIRRRFLDVREEVESLYREFEPLGGRQRNRVLGYYREFYRVLENPRSFEWEIVRACLEIS